jgi:hypothetical protein
MFEKYACRITGVAPLIQHNGQLADPLNYFAKEMKKISGKRHKTEADLEQLARLEWRGSLYLNNGRVVIPGEVLEAHLVEAAKKVKKGPQAKAGLFCDGMFLLDYDGPRDVEALWSDEAFRMTAGVRVQRNRIMRTRPIFHVWSLSFEVQYNASQLNLSEIAEFVRIGGEQIGLGDWRPRFGRYLVEEGPAAETIDAADDA